MTRPPEGFRDDHARLYLQEERRIGQLLGILARAGLPPDRIVVFVADLRGQFGALMASSAFGDAFVAQRLARAAASGILPSAAVPVEQIEALPAIRELFPDLLVEVLTRAPGTLPVIMLSAEDVAVVTFCEVADATPN